ncbi:AP-1 complex-associated regulatory protein isoform X2 [Eucyclogobius newberryi]|uniref:AP-1 complex-associated regulatory protein isoform X2 n=1 Tax=Eucyclogobius newberryi TaxID=166745 RepID=UPI003B5A6E1F
MGTCWSYCAGLCRREADRLQRGGGSKYFRSSTVGEHYTIEFENLVESDEGGESPQPCPKAISEDELQHLRHHHYSALSEKQLQIDEKLRRESATQRSRGRADGATADATDQRKQNDREEFSAYLQNVKAQSEAFRSNRLPSDPTVVTPNTELSWDFTTKTRSTEDGTSLDLEWEDEEGINRSLPPWERSRTEEDILRAALRPGSKPTSDESAALEWENDFISSQDLAPRDLAPRDLGPRDLGQRDLGPRDLGQRDLGQRDLGPRDLAPRDIGLRDIGQDLGPQDLEQRDLRRLDLGPLDSELGGFVNPVLDMSEGEEPDSGRW